MPPGARALIDFALPIEPASDFPRQNSEVLKIGPAAAWALVYYETNDGRPCSDFIGRLNKEWRNVPRLSARALSVARALELAGAVVLSPTGDLVIAADQAEELDELEDDC